MLEVLPTGSAHGKRLQLCPALGVPEGRCCPRLGPLTSFRQTLSVDDPGQADTEHRQAGWRKPLQRPLPCTHPTPTFWKEGLLFLWSKSSSKNRPCSLSPFLPHPPAGMRRGFHTLCSWGRAAYPHSPPNLRLLPAWVQGS